MIDQGGSMRNQCVIAGDIKSYRKETFGISGEADNCKFKILFYDSRTVRVSITHKENFEDLPYILVSEPEPDNFVVEDLEDKINIETDQLIIRISRKPFRISFVDKNGKIINEDDKGFGISWIGDEISNYKTLQKNERFIGLGEKTGNLDRRGSGYENWNTDHYGYGNESDPLYGSYPFYIGIHNEMNYGIFLHNAYRSYFNFGASNNRFSSFSVESGDLDYFFIYDDIPGIINSYSRLTGYMELPPLWSLGFQQCRFSYYPEEEVFSVARNFREKMIPCDAIVLDIHYMEAYKIFTWNKKRFKDPGNMINKLNEEGFSLVVIIDPGIKIEDNYEIFEDGLENDVFLKYPDGEAYTGAVWPGWCYFPDFSREKTRQWWGNNIRVLTDVGVQGFWNDMNEFATWGNKLPNVIEFDFDGEKGTTKLGRNLYGLLMSRSTFEGVKKQNPNERHFFLTRSGFSGIQRYAAVWTGDNVASDENMLLGVRIVNSMGLTGIPFAGYDIGGFSGEADAELFARWIQVGAFCPFFRVHTMVNTRDSEPWAYGERVEEISRNYINLRYKLLPYLYSLMWEASESGMPVSRSLAINYPHDDRIYQEEYQNQFLFGPSFLIAPIKSDQNIIKVYLPEGDWYNFHSYDSYKGNNEIILEAPLENLPVFIKAGSIIPMQDVVQSTAEKSNGILYLHVYYSQKSNAFKYFEDDGISYTYQSGGYFKRNISLIPENKEINISKAEGDYDSNFSQIKIILHHFEISSLQINDREVFFEEESIRFLEPISKYDPLGNSIEVLYESVKSFTINNDKEEIVIKWK